MAPSITLQELSAFRESFYKDAHYAYTREQREHHLKLLAMAELALEGLRAREHSTPAEPGTSTPPPRRFQELAEAVVRARREPMPIHMGGSRMVNEAKTVATALVEHVAAGERETLATLEDALGELVLTLVVMGRQAGFELEEVLAGKLQQAAEATPPPAEEAPRGELSLQ